MSRPKRSPVVVTLDRIEMVKLMRKGYTQSAIAEKMGVSQQQISKDWKLVHDDLKEQRNRDYDAVIAIRLEQYSEVMREAREAWDESKVGYDKEGNAYTKPGDAEHLRTVLNSLDAMCDLKGS